MIAWHGKSFTDGLERIVYADAGTQFVYDDEGNKIVGMWMRSEEIEADVPLVVN